MSAKLSNITPKSTTPLKKHPLWALIVKKAKKSLAQTKKLTIFAPENRQMSVFTHKGRFRSSAG